MTTTAEHPDTTGWAEIRVETPLPLEVAGTLMQLIGTAWPDAMIRTNGPRHSLTMLVDHHRRPKKVTKKATQALVSCEADAADEAHAAGVGDAQLLGFDGGGIQMSTPEELSLHLGDVCRALLAAHDDPENYIEWEVRTRASDDEPARHYVLSAARSKGQTPHALRTRAEKELADLRAQMRALADDADLTGVPINTDHVRALAGPEGERP